MFKMGEYQATGLRNVVDGVLQSAGYEAGTSKSFRIHPDEAGYLKPEISVWMTEGGLRGVTVEFKTFHEYRPNGTEEGRILTPEEAGKILLQRNPNGGSVRHSYDRSRSTSYFAPGEWVTTDPFRGTQEWVNPEAVDYDKIKSIDVKLGMRFPLKTEVASTLFDHNDFREYQAVCEALGIPLNGDRRQIEEQMRKVAKGVPTKREVFGRKAFSNIGDGYAHSRNSVLQNARGNGSLTATTRTQTYGKRLAEVAEIWFKESPYGEKDEWVQMKAEANPEQVLRASNVRDLEKAVLAAEDIIGRPLVSEERTWSFF